MHRARSVVQYSTSLCPHVLGGTRFATWLALKPQLASVGAPQVSSMKILNLKYFDKGCLFADW